MLFSVLIRKPENGKVFKPATCEEAKRIIRAKNDAATQPAINISIAKAYLVGTDPKLVERTWAFVMQEFCAVKKDSTRLRRERAIKSPCLQFHPQ